MYKCRGVVQLTLLGNILLFRHISKALLHQIYLTGMATDTTKPVKQAADREKFFFFWKNKSPFSQWHEAVFVLDDVEFNCAEQYMMYRKAKLFKDEDTAMLILKSYSPRDQKALGRKVHNFDEEVWTANCKEIVKTGNMAKFGQNEPLKQKLLATAGHTLVEASPIDRIWGIGLSQDDPRARDRSKWRGTNWLGEILTEVREEILKSDLKGKDEQP